MKKMIVAIVAALAIVGGFEDFAHAAAPTVTVSWVDNSSGSGQETGFNIERKNGACASAASWFPIGNSPADSTSWVDVSVSGGATYCYRVSAANSAGISPASAPPAEVFVPAPVVVPNAPSGASATAN